MRDDVQIIPLDILKQKYMLHYGYLMISLNKNQEACRYFTKCLVSNKTLFIYLENWRNLWCENKMRMSLIIKEHLPKSNLYHSYFNIYRMVNRVKT